MYVGNFSRLIMRKSNLVLKTPSTHVSGQKVTRYSEINIDLPLILNENKLNHVTKTGVFDFLGVISLCKKVWGVFSGNRSTTFKP